MSRELPAEWSPQGAAMLIWPHDGTDWAARLDDAEAAFAALAVAITRYQPALVVCRDAGVRRRALARLEAAGCPRVAVATVLVDSDDTWARDISPIPVTDDGLPLLVDCGFNGWGGRHAHARDRAFGRALVDSAGFATLGYERADIVLEGGAIDSDGAGTLLVNRPCVLDPARNPGLDAAAAEAMFARHFGTRRTLWLDVPGLAGDDTGGHVDTLARFCAPGTIAHAAPHAPDDDDATTLEALAQQLRALRTPAGEPYALVPLPGPAPVTGRDGTRRPASYANFLIVNDAVLVPAYADAADAVAAERLQAAFPRRAVLPVPARTFVAEAGALHCLTMQLPEGALEDLALS